MITISPEVIMWILSGLIFALTSLIAILYSNVKERISRMENRIDMSIGDLETKLESRITDVDRHARHAIQDVNAGLRGLTTLVSMRRGDSEYLRRMTDLDDGK